MMKTAIALALVSAGLGLAHSKPHAEGDGYGGPEYETYDEPSPTPSSVPSEDYTPSVTSSETSYEQPSKSEPPYEPPVSSEEPATLECPSSYLTVTVTVTVTDDAECPPSKTTVVASPDTTVGSEPSSPPVVEISTATRNTWGTATFALVAGLAVLLGTM